MVSRILISLALIVCDPCLYDLLYERIIQQALQAPKLTQEVLDNRNNSITFLRALCRGQQSSYESGKSLTVRCP